MEIGSLVKRYIQTAIEYGQFAYEIMDRPQKTNAFHDKNQKYKNQLISLGAEGIEQIRLLLNHENDYVKYSAAAHYLPIDEELAKHVLLDLIEKYENAKGGLGLFRFSMEMLISEWNKGSLRNYL